MKIQSVNDVATPDAPTARTYRTIKLPPDADSSAIRYSTGPNVMHTGAGTCSTCPVGVNAPVVVSIRNTTMFPESSLAAKRNAPVGSIVKFLGVIPVVEKILAGVMVPLAASIL